MTRFNTLTILVGASLGVAACSGSINPGDTQTDNNNSSSGTTGGSDDTFDHDNDSISVWDLIDRLTKEGPPSFTSHVHSCSKVRYTTLGAVLTSVGVNLATKGTVAAPTAGDLYTSGASAMGTSNFANRIRENIDITTSGASREFDIFSSGATDVITNLPKLARCADPTTGTGPSMFDATGTQCNAAAITCLISTPATAEHVSLCNLTISNASTPAIGQRMAVAALLAAAYTCE